MHQAVSPVDASAAGLVEQAQDATAPQGLLFHHANEGRPLATPWQIAALRAQALMLAAAASNSLRTPRRFSVRCSVLNWPRSGRKQAP